MEYEERLLSAHLRILAHERSANILQKLGIGLVRAKVLKGFLQRKAHGTAAFAFDKRVGTRLSVLAARKLDNIGQGGANGNVVLRHVGVGRDLAERTTAGRVGGAGLRSGRSGSRSRGGSTSLVRLFHGHVVLSSRHDLLHGGTFWLIGVREERRGEI